MLGSVSRPLRRILVWMAGGAVTLSIVAGTLLEVTPAVGAGLRAPALVFGIYPGGAAGTVGPSGATRADDPKRQLAALQRLRADGQPFVLHLYASYTGPGGVSATEQVGEQIRQFTAAGFQIELVLTYRPADGGSAGDVKHYVRFVSDTVVALGVNRHLVSLQVTNEANIGGAPNASDGYYRGAENALINGVIAAAGEARRLHYHQIKVGFNWANDSGAGQIAFWKYLGRHGGRRFRRSLDWVGLDAYPGTWGPTVDPGNLAAGTRATLIQAFNALRNQYLPLARIPHSVPLHIAESGYPTGPGRTEAMQETAMRAAISTVDAARGSVNITAYRWFDLRDADSSSSSFESQYGLMRDDYAPKPAFELYRKLIALYG